MATKKEKKWGTILGAIAGGIITYQNTKGEEDRFLKVLAGRQSVLREDMV